MANPANMPDITRAVARLKQRLWLERSALSVMAAVSCGSVAQWASARPIYAIATGIVVLAFGLASTRTSRRFNNLSPKNFLLHLNRLDKGFEESAQLLLPGIDASNHIQNLQRKKMASYYADFIKDETRWLPQFNRQLFALFMLFLALSLLLHLAPQPDWHAGTDASRPFPVTSQEVPIASLQESRITITPPAYTDLPTRTEAALNITALEGSAVSVELSFNRADGAYFLKLSDDEVIPLEKTNSGTFKGNFRAETTNLFRLVHRAKGKDTPLDDVYTLTVEKDRRPQVRILAPKTTTLEIPKAGPARFTSTALINDDFGISDVIILASVAKGTGEAVKFRDETFRFDTSEATEGGMSYMRAWDLETLDMEPGDEIYFRVVAKDNRKPTANEGKSATVIVRWLDEQEREIAAEGIASNFVPEYFKSQRQIIIETEQLIADRPVLDEKAFAETSYGLGHAQSDLKQRYGQYLGDEFGEGPGEQLGGHGAGESHADDDHDNDEHNDEDDHAEMERPEIGHAHEGETLAGDGPMGAAELIARFGHAHGDADVGPIAKRDPKTLMKKAVSIMWQAELHLMLAEPEKALPYEYEALKYLKLAKQADRIYVKRLGFEPPPVSEDRRLEGELDEINSFERSIEPGVETLEDQRLYETVFQMLATKSMTATAKVSKALSGTEKDTLKRLSAKLMEQAVERPAMVIHAATIEKILIASSVHLPACEDCVATLKNALWNMLPEATAAPRARNVFYLPQDPMVQASTGQEAQQ